MAKKKKLGSDPLEFIKDSRGEAESKQSKPSLQGLQKKLGRPKTSTRVITSSTQDGLKEGWTRATFIVNEAQLEKLKAYAYWERKQIKEVIETALEAFLKGKHIKPLKGDK